VILTTGCNRWDEGLDAVVEGDAVRITDRDRLERLAKVWATTWDGRWQYLVRDGCFYHHDDHEVLPDAILVFSVKPTKIFAFAKGDPFQPHTSPVLRVRVGTRHVLRPSRATSSRVIATSMRVSFVWTSRS
jgi:hypothetical protein